MKKNANRDAATLLPLSFPERALLAYDGLRLRCDDHGGSVGEDDVQDLAAEWTTTSRECPVIPHDDYHALRDALLARLINEDHSGGPMSLRDDL